MHLGRTACAAMALAVCVAIASAQPRGASDQLQIDASTAYTWNDSKTTVLQLQGPVKIEADGQTLSADQAVLWLTPLPDTAGEQEQAQVALIGDASVKQPAEGIQRSGKDLLVTLTVRASVRVTADDRLAKDLSDSALYREAAALRTTVSAASEPTSVPVTTAPAEPSPEPTSAEPGAAETSPVEPLPGGEEGVVLAPGRGGRGQRAIVRRPPPTANPTPSPEQPVQVHADQATETTESDGTAAVVLAGHVSLRQRRVNGDYIELSAERVVVFTDVHPDALDRAGGITNSGDHVKSAYLEGDVRIDYTPASGIKPEQRLDGNRVYYDFATDRAILTDAILHTTEPLTHIPVVIRADVVRQLAHGEYTATNAQLSTSNFLDPSYSVKTEKVYVHQVQPVAPTDQAHADFIAEGDTMQMFGFPVFYWPRIAGSIDNDEVPLRTIQIGNSNRFGVDVQTTWGLFESLGKPHPRGLDLSYVADYFSKRGPAVGFNASYDGGFITDTDKQPWNFEGKFKGIFVYDHGEDILGGDRTDVHPPTDYRGQFLYEHQHFFPDGWQAQLRLGYTSDPTFLEEYYPQECFTGPQRNVSAYFKRQNDTEVITFDTEVNTTRWVTTSDQQQEQFDIERLPEIGYHRVGDPLGDDTFTYFGDTSLSRLRFAKSHASLADQGFVGISPGIPAEGFTGTVSSPTYRADTRQEIDYPLNVDQFKVVPFVLGRYTAYSNSPENDVKNRLFGGVGVRVTTEFWKVDDSAESELFDIHRVRHIIEPEVNLFTSATTVDRSHVFIYDDNVDAINDITAAQVALHQRWETKRGAPGRERSVDFLDVNFYGNFFANQPPKDQVPLSNFRGLFFPSDPEASIARDSVNADATWRISDTTAFLSDAQINLDSGTLATASVGLAVQRDERLSYYVGTRYIEPLNSNITTFSANYQLTAKYALQFSQSFDFGQGKNVDTNITISRDFDRLIAEFTFYHDSSTDESGFRFNLFPSDLPQAGSAARYLAPRY